MIVECVPFSNFEKKMAILIQCLQMEYCSVECLKKAKAQYHQVLCIKSKARDGAHPVERITDVWK